MDQFYDKDIRDYRAWRVRLRSCDRAYFRRFADKAALDRWWLAFHCFTQSEVLPFVS